MFFNSVGKKALSLVEWRVYDIVIEGVSLINNHRTHLREMLSNKFPDALLDTLRKKISKI